MLRLFAVLCLIAGPGLAQVADDRALQEARDLFVAGDHAGALAVIRPAAEAGHPRAQNLMGSAYQYGMGVAADAGQAVDWFTRAADQGYPPGMHNLGVLYERGMPGLPSDLALAREWYGRGAALDYGPALGGWGQFLLNGLGGPRDLPAALDALERAEDLGDRNGTSWLAHALREGLGTETDLPRARRLYQIAGLQGDDSAMSNYGAMLEAGMGGEVDLAGAMASYRAALAMGNALAGINAAWVIDENPGAYGTPVEGVALCLAGLSIALPENAVDWQRGCDAMAADLTPAELTAAQKMIPALLSGS
jgi:TPR repeat protein